MQPMTTISKLVPYLLTSTVLLLGCANRSANPAPSESGPTSNPEPAHNSVPTKMDLEVVHAARRADRIKVGDMAPDFSLTDQHGKLVSLADIRRDSNVAVIFYRSAVW